MNHQDPQQQHIEQSAEWRSKRLQELALAGAAGWLVTGCDIERMNVSCLQEK